ncbi:MAG: sugar ABC transporter permease [Eubacteriales bacterium]|nr:sugar ABC transporter permease [Eubacteriales bacterium]
MKSNKAGGTGSGVKNFFAGIGRYFYEWGAAVVHSDGFVKLSVVLMGAGHIRRGKYLQGAALFVLEICFCLFCATFAADNLAKFGTLGSVQAQKVFDPVLFTNVWNDYDHSFKILLYGIVSLIIIAMFILLWMNSVRSAYRLQQTAEKGEHISSLREDLHNALDKKYYRTLLALPITGVILFTVIPLIVMIAVAFTNYDQQHMPPNALFTWVGLDNFKALFSTSMTITFGYSFQIVLIWTLIWAVTSTFTCYIGGILLALLINNKRTRAKKMWRTCFIIAMAVPQFVSLLLVRSFFADQGIVNTICSNIGLTDLLKQVGLVSDRLSYIPFLTDANWARVMIILINIWVGVPYLLLIATGVLMNIPQDLYEAATIDGANAYQQFKSITMPYMLFVTGPYLINSVVQNINNFNVIYLLTEGVYETQDLLLAGSHARETDLLVTWLFRLTNNYYNYKMASVIGILVFVVCSVITLVCFNVVIRGNREEAMR